MLIFKISTILNSQLLKILFIVYLFLIQSSSYSYAQNQPKDSVKSTIKLNFNYKYLHLFNAMNINDSLKIKYGDTFEHYGNSIQYFATIDNYNFVLLNYKLNTNSNVYEVGNTIVLNRNVDKVRNKLDATRYWHKNFYLLTDFDSKIYINDIYISTGPSLLNIKSDDKIRLKNDVLNEEILIQPKEEFKALFEAQTVSFRPNKENVWKKIWIPGWAQWEKREYNKSIFFISISAGLSLSAISSYLVYNHSKNEFNNYYDSYRISTTVRDIVSLRKKMDTSINMANTSKNIYNNSLVALVLIYITNVVDALPLGNTNYFKKVEFDPFIDKTFSIKFSL